MKARKNKNKASIMLAGSVLALAAAGCAATQTSSHSRSSSSSQAPTASETQLISERGRALLSNRITRAELREQAIAELEQQAFSQAAVLRANALEGLSLVPARVEQLALAGLADPNPGVRSVAAMTVGELRIERAQASVAQLVRDESPRVRASAIYALKRLGAEVDPTPLAGMLRSPDPNIRSQAAFVLGEIGDPSAAPLLRDALLHERGGQEVDRQRFVLQVAEALVKLGDENALNTIRAALYPSKIEQFENAVLAAQILGELNDHASVSQLIRVIEYVTPDSPQGNAPGDGGYRGDPDEQTFIFPPEMRLAAAGALARLGYHDGVFVAQQYQGESWDAVRAQAAYTYGLMGSQADVAVSEGRQEFAAGLAAAQLSQMLEDRAPMVRVHAAAGALRLIGDTESAR